MAASRPVYCRGLAAACVLLALGALGACGREKPARDRPDSAGLVAGTAIADTAEHGEAIAVDDIAERFVKLALALGHYDKAYVDAYHGPEAWAEAADNPPSLEALTEESAALISALDRTGDRSARGRVLRKILVAAQTRLRMAQGATFSFDEETRLLYDAVAPAYDLAAFDTVLDDIDALLPGAGTTAERVDAFRATVAIPSEKLAAVFDAAIAECRKRTVARYALPASERFSIGYVFDKPWSGYNWYRGDYESLIEINTDFPIHIDRAVDLGCHEGYPGHHTWNVLIEQTFVKANGWDEYLVYPLFSPLSLLAEGSANYGIELAFPGDEKIAFERDVLFPLAGLDPEKAPVLASLNALLRKLSHANNHSARRYLDGEISREAAIDLTVKYRLQPRDKATQSIRFIETYRGYVINYNLGRDLVASYIDARRADGVEPWRAFNTLLTQPVSASDIEGMRQSAGGRVE